MTKNSGSALNDRAIHPSRLRSLQGAGRANANLRGDDAHFDWGFLPQKHPPESWPRSHHGISWAIGWRLWTPRKGEHLNARATETYRTSIHFSPGRKSCRHLLSGG